MIPDEASQLHRVVLRVSARRHVLDDDLSHARQLLTGPGGAWSGAVVRSTEDGEGLELEVVVAAGDPAAAARGVVDRVRALAGLDARLARWTVEARLVRVVPFPG